jgi:hypothetical protein
MASKDTVAVPDTRTNLLIATGDLNLAVGDYVTKQEVYGSDAEKGQRRRIIDVAKKILAEASDPADQWLDMITLPARVVSNRCFWYWGGFDALPDQGDIAYSDLAQKIDVEEALLGMFYVVSLVLQQHICTMCTWLVCTG